MVNDLLGKIRRNELVLRAYRFEKGALKVGEMDDEATRELYDMIYNSTTSSLMGVMVWVNKAEGMLLDIQWGGQSGDCCPVCGKSPMEQPEHQHRPGCELSALLWEDR